MSPEPPGRPRGAVLLQALTGFIAGAASRLNVLASSDPETTVIPGTGGLLLQCVLWGIGGAALFLALRSGIRLWAMKLPWLDFERYLRLDTWTYAVFLLSLAGGVGVIFRLPVAVLMWGLFALAQGLLILSCLPKESRKGIFVSRGWLACLFLLSGFAALIYQIAWQRVLFAIFGVNIESVTVIVSIFMFGLGVGALVGGWVAKKFPGRLPELFFAVEIGIAVFGVFSLSLIHWAGEMTLRLPLPSIALVVYALLALPTMLMGSTLPLLVEYLTQRDPGVGRSVGTLYFFNTLGSAFACFATAAILFVWLGLQGAVYVAAGFNFITGLLVLRYCRKSNGEAPGAKIAKEPVPVPEREDSVAFPTVLLLSALTGFLSLSQEIIWVRALGFMTAGAPAAFANVLGWFLFGIAFGALWGKRVCGRTMSRGAFVGRMIQTGSLFFLIAFLLMMLIGNEHPWLMQGILYAFVAVTAFFSGACFPVLCDLAADAKKSGGKGMTVSWMYVANIAGSTAGSLSTGFWLLESFRLAQIVPLLGGTGILAGLLLVLFLGNGKTKWAAALTRVAVVVIVLAGGPKIFSSGMMEELQMTPPETRPFKHIVENRGGIITVEHDEEGDICYGGGIYDGRYAVAPGSANGIHRAFVAACMQREPKRVLEIGMSTGSWAWVLARHEAVETVDIVEINPGYVHLLAMYPEHSTLPSDPKVTIHIDDGRRWLNRHDDKFDFILMNTTYHWRSHATNLLSREFLELCREHLNPGGVVYWNTTHNEDILRTAAEVFDHVTQWSNFVAAGDSPFDMTAEERRANLLRYKRDGRPILLENEEYKKELEMLVTGELPELKEKLLARPDLRVITDNNMATEFIRGDHRLFDPEKGWAVLFNREK